MSARSLGYLLGASQLGRFIDRRGCHRFLALIIVAGAALAALVPLMNTLWSLAVIMGLIGVTLAGPDVGSNTLIMRLHRDNPGPAMNGLHLFFGVGALIAPLLVAWTRSETSIAWSYWSLSLLVALIGVAFLFRPEPPLETPSHEAAPQSSVRSLLFFGCVVFTLYVGAEVGFGNWIFEYVNVAFGEDMATQITTGFWITFTLFRLIGVGLALRFSALSVVIASLCTGAAACVLLYVSAPSVSILWGSALLFGAGVAAVYPTFLVFLGKHMSMTGRRLGVIAVASTLGSMSFPWLIGQRFAAWSPQALPLIVGIDLLLALGIILFIIRRLVSKPVPAPKGGLTR